MHTVFALLCFVVVIHWLIFPYPSGLLHWHCGNLTIAPVPAKQPWWIWINTSCKFIMNDCITTTKQSTTKQCIFPGIYCTLDALIMALLVHLSIFLMLYNTIWWQGCSPQSILGAVITGKNTKCHGCFKPRTSLISSALNVFWYKTYGSVMEYPYLISFSFVLLWKWMSVNKIAFIGLYIALSIKC